MKKSFVILIGLLLIASVGVFAKDTEKKKIAGDTWTLTGTIIDNLCAGAHKSQIGDFIKTHTKDCATKPDCAASGYSLYHYGSLLLFDAESNKKIINFLKDKNSTLAVSVTVKKAGEKYSLISIKNK